MQSIKSIDLTRLLAWMVVLISVVEWFPFFVQIMLNFFNMNLREFPIEDIFLVLAPIISPLITVFLSISGNKKPETMRKVMSVLGVVVIIPCIILNWFSFSAYYQFYGIFAPDLSTIGATSGAYGILDYLTPAVKPLLYWTNAFTFYVTVPVLFTAATGGTGRLQYSHELNLGGLAAALYMFLRPGSIVDTTFRFAIVLLVVAAIWLIFLVNKTTNETRDTNLDPYFIDLNHIPKWTEEGLAILVGVSLLNPAMSAMGLLHTTWIWAFLAISTGVVELMILKKVKFTSRVPGMLVFGGLVVMESLVIWADIDAALLAIEPWLHGCTLLLLGFLFPACSPFFSRKRENRYLSHPGRQFLFNLIAVVSFLLPLLIIATFPPLTTLAGVLIVAIGGGLSLFAMVIADRKGR